MTTLLFVLKLKGNQFSYIYVAFYTKRLRWKINFSICGLYAVWFACTMNVLFKFAANDRHDRLLMRNAALMHHGTKTNDHQPSGQITKLLYFCITA